MKNRKNRRIRAVSALTGPIPMPELGLDDQRQPKGERKVARLVKLIKVVKQKVALVKGGVN